MEPRGGGAVLDSQAFVASMKERLSGLPREVSGAGAWRASAGWEWIVKAVEVEHGGRWEEVRDLHGDWGRDVAFCFGRRNGRMMLRELGAKVGALRHRPAVPRMGTAGRNWIPAFREADYGDFCSR